MPYAKYHYAERANASMGPRMRTVLQLPDPMPAAGRQYAAILFPIHAIHVVQHFQNEKKSAVRQGSG